MGNLDAFFSPESVAVIEASGTPGKVGHDIFADCLRGVFQGALDAVHPNAKAIPGFKTFRTIRTIRTRVVSARVILPSQASPTRQDPDSVNTPTTASAPLPKG